MKLKGETPLPSDNRLLVAAITRRKPAAEGDEDLGRLGEYVRVCGLAEVILTAHTRWRQKRI